MARWILRYGTSCCEYRPGCPRALASVWSVPSQRPQQSETVIQGSSSICQSRLLARVSESKRLPVAAHRVRVLHVRMMPGSTPVDCPLSKIGTQFQFAPGTALETGHPRLTKIGCSVQFRPVHLLLGDVERFDIGACASKKPRENP